MRTTRLTIAFMTVLSTWSHAEPPRDRGKKPTEDDLADPLIREARELLKRGQLREACDRFVAGNAEGATLWGLGQEASCHERLGRLASAWRTLVHLEGEASGKDEDTARFARRARLRLEPLLARVIVHVPGDTWPEGLTVSLDGATLEGRTLLGMPVFVDEGSHTVRAWAAGNQGFVETFPIHNGKARDVVIVLHDDTRIAGPENAVMTEPFAMASASERPGRTRRILTWTALGAGAVGLAAGGYVGLRARSQWSDAQAAGCDVGGACSGPGAALADDARSSARTSTILVGGGAALAVTGLVLWLTAPDASPEEQTTRTSALQVTPLLGSAAGLTVTASF